MESTNRFEDKLARIHEAIGSDRPSVLARILGIDPASIAAAKKRKQIPGGWVETIAEKCDISANWLYFGYGVKEMIKHDGSALHNGTRTYGGDKENEKRTCPRCTELLEELVQSQKEVVALMKENGALRAEVVTLLQRLSPPTTVSDESPHAKMA